MSILVIASREDERLWLEQQLEGPELPGVILIDSPGQAHRFLVSEDSAGKGSSTELIIIGLPIPALGEVISRLRGPNSFDDVPILLLTGPDEFETLKTGLISGANDYIARPVDEMELHTRVASLLRLGREIASRKEYEAAFRKIEKQFEEKKQTFEALSPFDDITGVYNRQYFDKMMYQEWMRGTREASPVSLVLIDIDFFKNFNETYGPEQGDICLNQVAGVLNNVAKRPGDSLTRYDKDMFAAILPNTDREGGIAVARKMLEEVAELNIPHSASEISERVTVTLGVGSLIPDWVLEPEQMVAGVKQALAEAQQEGRNRLKLADQFYPEM